MGLNIPQPNKNRGAVLAIGVFDGVHIGHRKIVEELCCMATRLKCAPVVMSFDPHPRSVVAPESAPPLLISPLRRKELLLACGAGDVLLTPFTCALSQLKPEEFLHNILNFNHFDLHGIVVGRNWSFGRKAAGNTETLSDFSRKNKIEFTPVDEVIKDGETVSSSRIRLAIARGELQNAKELLGRNPELSGSVEHGLNIGGRKLAAPTANVQVTYGVQPPDGVYAARVRFDGKIYKAALNIGITPTVAHLGTTGRRVEVHLMGFTGNLYGENIEIELIKFIREERRFGSLTELKAQIANDIAQIETIAGEK